MFLVSPTTDTHLDRHLETRHLESKRSTSGEKSEDIGGTWEGYKVDRKTVCLSSLSVHLCLYVRSPTGRAGTVVPFRQPLIDQVGKGYVSSLTLSICPPRKGLQCVVQIPSRTSTRVQRQGEGA